jgi:acetoacetyl-CoA reductase
MGAQRIAIVTGNAEGVGAAVCRRLADAGCGVVAIHITPEEGARWRDAGVDASYQADLSDYQSCESVVRKIVSDAGRVDILVNNAVLERDAAFSDLSDDDWNAMRRTNLDSVFNMSRPVLHGMLESGWGRIVNVSSIIAQEGAPGRSGLASAQSAVHGFTKALALELASKGITVNTVSHGHLDAGDPIPKEALEKEILPRIPVGRLGKPSEVAGLVAYLCCDEAGFLTGANIAINGGQYMF